MNNEAPLITIGMTCFNAESTIEGAVRSALKQDWPNIEIVIVDDCSSDNSITILDRLAKEDDRINFVRHDVNKGFPSALNSIIEHSCGEYLAFFDDDDESLPHRLSAQYERIVSFKEQHKDSAVFCYSNRRVVSEPDNKFLYEFKAIGHSEPEPFGEIVADYILWNSGETGYVWGMFGSCTLMVEKKVLENLGGFDPFFRRNAEWDLAVRGAMNGAYFISVNENLVTQHKTPTIDKKGKIPLKYSLALRKKHKKFLMNKNVYWVSLIVSRSRFYCGKGKQIPRLFFYFLCCLLAPKKILLLTIKKRLRAK